MKVRPVYESSQLEEALLRAGVEIIPWPYSPQAREQGLEGNCFTAVSILDILKFVLELPILSPVTPSNGKKPANTHSVHLVLSEIL